MPTASFLYQKLVDRSTLRQGFSIPVECQDLFLALSGGLLVHGETMLHDDHSKNVIIKET